MTHRASAGVALALLLTVNACREEPISPGRESSSGVPSAPTVDAPSVPSTTNAARRAALTKHRADGEAYRVGAGESAVETGFRRTNLALVGVLFRTEQRACPSAPRTNFASEVRGGCRSDADCGAKPNGHCVATPRLKPGGAVTSICDYGCAEDSDCSEGEICVCGPDYGTCVANRCPDIGCAEGELCASCDRFPREPFRCLSEANAKSECSAPTP